MTRVPITSPLAVLTTRTTQEHIMTTHSTTDLKPGDFVQHPEKGRGLVHRRFARNGVGVVYADKDRDGITSYTSDLTGWERVEAVRPGHVQVRVDDLDPQTLSEWSQWMAHCIEDEALVRVGRAMIASQVEHGDPSPHWPAESTSPADEPEIVGDGCECWVTPEHMWTTYGSAVEPGSQVEHNPRCPKHGEKPTSATVTLFCPDCGGAENVTVVMLGKQSNGERWFDLREFHAHTCPPAQPDEPQEFGAKATVAQADGHIERWLNMHAPPQGRRGWLTWDARDTAGSTPGQSKWADWGEIIQRGTVTLGWDE
ncbi:hypothetical protein [Dermacoccus nishinomiyaensis]|uniref:hypothetical protein n=1 Tax=Dermacoccus nishinomiyaensis TaxID=1274 RepID=UPI00248DC733|nr:hypothetical protein [Dermacoccus nishinomiyaensis]